MGTIGKTAAGGSWTNTYNQCKYATKFVAGVTIDVTGGSVLFGNAPNQVRNIRMAVYADSAGLPGARLGVSDARNFASPGPTGAQAFVFSTPFRITAGTTVWIAVQPDYAMDISSSVSAGATKHNGDDFSDGATDPFGAAPSNDDVELTLSVSGTDVVSLPTITSISPTHGPHTGGTAVTITGTGFTGQTGATVGGVALTSFAVVNDTTITGTTGSHAAGAVDVVVGTATLAGGFTYEVIHLVVTPNHGPASGGNRVRVTYPGIGLGGGGTAPPTLPPDPPAGGEANYGTPNYYVSTGGNDSNDGTSLSPFRTLQHAADVARAGDVVEVAGGTYNEIVSLDYDGTASDPIVFVAKSGETPVIDGTGKGGASDGLLMVMGDYVIVDGLEVKNAGTSSDHMHCVYVEGRHSTVRRCHIHHSTACGIRVWLASVMPSYFTAEYNHIHHCDDGTVGGADGIAISGNDAGMGQYDYGSADACNAVLRGNLIHDCTDDGIDCWNSAGNLVERNVIFNSGVAGWWSGIGQDGNGLKLGSDGAANPGGHHVARYNVVYDCTRRGLDTNGGAGNIIYGNTCYSNGLAGVQVHHVAAATGTTRVHNNLSIANQTSRAISGGGIVSDHNSWDLGITDGGFASTTAPASPTSVDDYTTFLHLAAGSACIGAGTTDIAGQAVTVDDLGAYEYGG